MACLVRSIGTFAVGMLTVPWLGIPLPSTGVIQTPIDAKPTAAALTLVVNAHNAGDNLAWAREALAAHAGMIEIDVARIGTALLASHDTGPLRRLTALPQLGQSWRIARATGRVLFDIKSNSLTAVDQLIRFAMSHRGPADWFSTPDIRALDRVGSRLPASIRLLTVGNTAALARLLAAARRPGLINGVSIDQRLLTRRIVKELRRRRLLVQVYTVDLMSRINELASWGVTGVTTDNLADMSALSRAHP